MFEAVLFDLDGTLADTAPDLCGTVNILLTEEGRPQQPFASLRPHTSQGVRGLLGQEEPPAKRMPEEAEKASPSPVRDSAVSP